MTELKEKKILEQAANSLQIFIKSIDPLIPKDHAEKGVEVLKEWSKDVAVFEEDRARS